MRAAATGIPKADATSWASTSVSQPPPRPMASSITRRAPSLRTSSNSGARPAGRSRHAPYAAARASAMAADSGNMNAGIGASFGAAPSAPMKLAATVFPPGSRAPSTMAAATWSASASTGGM